MGLVPSSAPEEPVYQKWSPELASFWNDQMTFHDKSLKDQPDFVDFSLVPSSGPKEPVYQKSAPNSAWFSRYFVDRRTDMTKP